ncbi:MAG: hypothetical protein AAF738_06085, partial [Bacteroidota bacterium]
MASNNTNIHLECMYAATDEVLQVQLAAHLDQLRQDSIIDSIHYQLLQNYQAIEAERLEQTDIYLILVSADFLATDFMPSMKRKELMELQQSDALRMILVRLRPCHIEESLWKGVPQLPENGEPITGEHWHNTDKGLMTVVNSIKKIAQERRTWKEQLENDWARTKNSKKAASFGQFLKNYPQSRYNAEAATQKAHLEEEGLWEKVTRTGNMDNLFKYLQQAPLQEYREEALERILDIREDEEVAWKDAQNNQELAFYMDYRRRFPTGKHLEETDDWIDNFMLTPFNYTENSLKLEQFYLQKRALEQLNPKEYLTMESCIRYTERTKKALKKIIATLRARIGLFQIIAAIALTLPIVGSALVYFYFGPEKVTLPALIRYFIPSILGSLVAMTIMGIVQGMQKDLATSKAELDGLAQTKVLLQLLFILHDKRGIFDMLTDLF